MKYHISKKTQRPNLCKAEIRDCPLGENTPHFQSKKDAQTFMSQSLEKEFSSVLKSETKVKEKISLWTPLGPIEIDDGDLSHEEARNAFTSGLCGDLALAIHDQTGRDIYFIVPKNEASEVKQCLTNPKYISDFVTHAVIASSEKGSFVDSHGRTLKKDLLNFYNENFEESVLFKGNREMLVAYTAHGESGKYEEFAKTALNFDKENISYPKTMKEY